MKPSFQTAICVLILVQGIQEALSTDRSQDRALDLIFDLYPQQELTLPQDIHGVKMTSTLVDGKMNCIFECLGVYWCRSVNFGTIPIRHGRHKCELLSSDQFTNRKNMAKNIGVNHYSVQNPCQHTPCRNGGECIFQDNRKDFRCKCKSGFTGDQCEKDIDECTSGAHLCHKTLARCTNNAGSYSCQCNSGYTGDGKTCSDIDECTSGAHSCHKTLARCTNNAGSYSCQCNAGYTGDGKTCSVGLEKSSILNGNANYINTLIGYLAQYHKTSQWATCWNTATDGWDVTKSFHPQCDGKGPTVTIVRVGSYVFGGYSDVPWHSQNKGSYSNKAFIYTLYNTNGFLPKKLYLKGGSSSTAVYGNSNEGPYFNEDLHIHNLAPSASSHTAPSVYQLPPGCSYGTECLYFAGKRPLLPSQIEVFYVKT